MFSHLLFILGVAVLSMALRSYHYAVTQKLGALGIFATSFLIGWLFSGIVAVGLICAASWLMLPWIEILTRIRRLRLPLEKNLRHKTPPNRDTFPDLVEITQEIEDEKFEHVEDVGWDWDDYQQFFRLFYKSSERAQAAVCLIDQNQIVFDYLSISSRAQDGTIWTTWNYPFSYSLKLVPQLRINRLRADYTFFEMHQSHCDWLRRHGIAFEQLQPLDGDKIQEEIQQDLRAQILHNLAKGVLTKTAEGQIRYSWRGLFFIWLQFLRDLVRLS